MSEADGTDFLQHPFLPVSCGKTEKPIAAGQTPLRGAMSQGKSISILIPCRNEVNSIEQCIANVFDFEPPEGGYEVIVIDGMSDDGTRERLERLKARYKDLIVLDNPERFVPHAMNLGIRRASGEYIVRVDARCIHPRNYLVELLALSRETGADNVGGVLHPMGTSYTQKAIAHAYRSRIAVGGALRDRGDYVGENDTVYGGCFRKVRLVEVGMYDEFMIRNQDDELSFRIREMGGRIYQSGKIRVGYFTRKHFRQLCKQFLQYGFWKVFVIRKHPLQAATRHYIPSLFVLGLIGMVLGSIFDGRIRIAALLLGASYVVVVLTEGLRACRSAGWRLWPGVAWAIVLMHIGYGTGFIIGFLSNAFDIRTTWFTTLSR